MAVRYGKTKSMKGFPIGSIVPWPVDSGQVPIGWIVCNGATLQTTRYPLLYDVVGNVYGGSANSTFTLPDLKDERAVVDIYPGHYSYLKTIGAAHYETWSTTLNSDPFWKEVGETINNSGVFNHQSSIDVVGEIATPKPNLVATVKDVIFTKGEYSESYGIHPRRLSDAHLASHTHGTDGPEDISTSWIDVNQGGDDCASNGSSTTAIIPDCTLNNTVCNQSLTWGNRRIPRNPGGTQAPGGSTVATNGQNLNNNGNGIIQGDMFARTITGSNVNLATDLSTGSATTWGAINGHTHEPTEGTFRCNVGAQKDYTFYDISSNGVSMVQPPPSLATINMNSRTPNLTMLFIIRAF